MPMGGGAGGLPTQQQHQEMQAKQAQAEDMRKNLLQKIMDPSAKERVDRIAIVKPEKAKRLEDMIIQMANKGQLQSQVNDVMLKQMLEQISEGDAAAPSNTVKFDRRRFGDDSDSDIDLSDL